MFSLSPVEILDANKSSETLTWSFDSDFYAFDYLSEGQSLILNFVITATDRFGSEASEQVTVTITGVNDTPHISIETGDSDSAALTESGSPLTAAGSLTVTDLDRADTVTAAKVSVTESGVGTGIVNHETLLGMLSLDATTVIASGSTVGTIAWTFDSGHEVFAHLPNDQSLTLTYTIQATDSSGATFEPVTEPKTIVITITGVNNAPTAGETLPPSQTVQYSDAIDTIRFTFSDPDRELLSVSLSYSLDGIHYQNLPDEGTIDSLDILDFSGGGEITEFGFIGTWTIRGIADVAPGTYTFLVTATDAECDRRRSRNGHGGERGCGRDLLRSRVCLDAIGEERRRDRGAESNDSGYLIDSTG